jgi:excisionase family DNA binding protein
MAATPRAADESEPLLRSVAETARLLHISEGKLYQLLDDGTIPSVRIGRRRLIRHSTLVDVVAQLERDGAA